MRRRREQKGRRLNADTSRTEFLGRSNFLSSNALKDVSRHARDFMAAKLSSNHAAQANTFAAGTRLHAESSDSRLSMRSRRQAESGYEAVAEAYGCFNRPSMSILYCQAC